MNEKKTKRFVTSAKTSTTNEIEPLVRVLLLQQTNQVLETLRQKVQTVSVVCQKQFPLNAKGWNRTSCLFFPDALVFVGMRN